MRSTIVAHTLSALAVTLAFACGPSGSAEETTPSNPTTLTTPGSNLDVKITLNAVTLGDDCGSGAGASVSAGTSAGAGLASDCAPSPDGGSCGGGGFCQQTNMQLTFAVAGTSGTAKVAVVETRIYVKGESTPFDTLKSREPQAWKTNAYVAWDETLSPGPDLKTSYKLSAPDWSKASSAKAPAGSSLYSREYEVEVVLDVDGVKRTLRVDGVTREPAVAT
ncbi:MAG: hypothetical protein U0169_09065 [Polyangiaceae bacterium]